MIYKKAFHKNNPVSFTLFELILFLILGILLNIILSNTILNNIPYINGIIVELVLGLLALVLMIRLGLFESRMFSGENLFLGLKLGFFIIFSGFIQFLIYLYLNINTPFSINLFSLAASVFYSFSIGFYEEVFMRGLLLQNLVKNYDKGVFNAVILSSLIFGLAHLINILHAPLFDTIVQVIYSMTAGLLFGVVFIKSKNLLSIIILHGVFNLFTYFTVNLYSTNFISYNLNTYPSIYILFNLFIIIGNLIFGFYLFKRCLILYF